MTSEARVYPEHQKKALKRIIFFQFETEIEVERDEEAQQYVARARDYPELEERAYSQEGAMIALENKIKERLRGQVGKAPNS